MHILITGGCGYVGCELLQILKNSNHKITVVDSDQTRIDKYKNMFDAEFICEDINNLSHTNADIIIHFAAIVGYLLANNQPELTVQTNDKGTAKIASLGKPVIYYSTGSVYGTLGETCTEDSPINPLSLYSKTKYAGESHVKKIDHIIFRPATAIGPGINTRDDLLVHDLTIKAINDKYIDLYQPTVMRSFYSVKKLAELGLYAAENFDLMKNQSYNVGCESGNINKIDIVNNLAKTFDFELEVVAGQDADNRDYNVDYKKLAAVWPDYKYDFNEIMEEVKAYYANR